MSNDYYTWMAKCPACGEAGTVMFKATTQVASGPFGAEHPHSVRLPMTAEKVAGQVRGSLRRYNWDLAPLNDATLYCDECGAEFQEVKEGRQFKTRAEFCAWIMGNEVAELRGEALAAFPGVREHVEAADEVDGPPWKKYTDGLEDEESLAVSRYLDARDLENIQRKIEAGEHLAALKNLRRLDTLVRDGVPNEVWEFLELQEEAAR